jgi:hypothetical protein
MKHKGEGGSSSPTKAALFHRAQASCRDRLNRLMARHEPLVHPRVHARFWSHLPRRKAL